MSFTISGCPSAGLHLTTIKKMEVFLRNSLIKKIYVVMFQFQLPSNNNYVRSRLMYSTQNYIFSNRRHGRNSLLVYRSEKCFSQMLLLKLRHILCTIHILRRPHYFREN